MKLFLWWGSNNWFPHFAISFSDKTLLAKNFVITGNSMHKSFVEIAVGKEHVLYKFKLRKSETCFFLWSETGLNGKSKVHPF